VACHSTEHPPLCQSAGCAVKCRAGRVGRFLTTVYVGDRLGRARQEHLFLASFCAALSSASAIEANRHPKF
jgi:hypothetical protein